MNPGLEKLQDYPFERLRNLKSKIPLKEHSSLIDLSIGEPRTELPKIIQNALVNSSEKISFYPSTRGTTALRESITSWLCRRFQIPENKLSPEDNILPVNGTREALFGISQALADTKNRKYIALPNPFYQVYEGAALLAGAQPFFMPCPKMRGFSPHFESIDPSIWRDTSLVYVCSPNNPSGSILEPTDYDYLLKMADIYNFIVVADECYSEIYQDESNPPLGLLEWCDRNGRDGYDKCLVVNSLSKRSGVPG
jgi:Aspartate/tyrosine/aromatic aminotransferase